MASRLIPGIVLLTAAARAVGVGNPSGGPHARDAHGTSTPKASAAPKNPEGYTDITVDDLAAMMPTKDCQLVNVHVPDQGNLPGTDMSIPFDEIGARANELPGKDAAIVLYCRSGNMSTQAAETLVGMGYTNVMELDGGFNAWRDSGRQMADTVTP